MIVFEARIEVRLEGLELEYVVKRGWVYYHEARIWKAGRLVQV